MSKVKIVNVDPMDPTKKNSPVLGEGDPSGEVVPDAVCYWNGVAYSPGAVVCDRGMTKECTGSGTWLSTGGTC